MYTPLLNNNGFFPLWWSYLLLKLLHMQTFQA